MIIQKEMKEEEEMEGGKRGEKLAGEIEKREEEMIIQGEKKRMGESLYRRAQRKRERERETNIYTVVGVINNKGRQTW